METMYTKGTRDYEGYYASVGNSKEAMKLFKGKQEIDGRENVDIGANVSLKGALISKEEFDEATGQTMSQQQKVEVTRKRVQINASGGGGDAITIKISDYPENMDRILIRVNSRVPEWCVCHTFRANANKRELDLTFTLGHFYGLGNYKDQSIDLIVIDRKKVGREFTFENPKVSG